MSMHEWGRVPCPTRNSTSLFYPDVGGNVSLIEEQMFSTPTFGIQRIFGMLISPQKSLKFGANVSQHAWQAVLHSEIQVELD